MLGRRNTGRYGTVEALSPILAICGFCSGAIVHASCSVDVVIVNGRVVNAPRNGIVRVQLTYPQQKKGELGETTLEDESFRIQIPFGTQSRRPVLVNLPERCDRKPETVVVSLVAGGQEYDHISLDLARDFKLADPSAYAPRAEIVLHGRPSVP
jgi:hypothetical protein